MRPQTIEIILFHDRQAERFEVSVRINKREVFLRRFPDINEAAAFMNKWISNRGYQWGPDSARRVEEAWQTDAIILILEAVVSPQASATMP